MKTTQPHQIPRVGMFATGSNRRGVLAAVEAFEGQAGRLNVVYLDYEETI